ncbi:MAG: hypothetical protein J6S85_11130 [Methanobrevibacter sp.]|nr:hypothetical protein [Methanobrevibacter sp.]
MNLLSEHNRILRLGEGGSQEYFPGDNINITDHVISGKYWDNEINSAISSTSGDIVDSAYNKTTGWVDEQGFLTAHQDVDNLPYVQNSALGYNGVLVSSISGSGLFAESSLNSFYADSAGYADNANSATYADSANFVATANFANSASSALNAEIANVAYTALTANHVEGGWEHNSDGEITAYNHSAFAGGKGDYSGISPIVVDNEARIISAQSAKLGVQEPLYFVEDSESATVIGIQDSAFPTFEGTEDGKISAINGSALNADPVVDYSGGSNISIVDHVISVTGIVNNAYHANSADHVQMAQSAHSAEIAISALNVASSNSATYDSLGRKIVDTYLTAHQDWTNTIQNASGNAYNSAVNWVVDQHYLTAVTGDNTPYSAGVNIDITDHVVSGKDWTTEIQAASAYAVDQATAQIPSVTEYSAGANIDITNHVISGKDWTNDITAAANSAFTAATASIPSTDNLPYVQNTALNIDNGSITSISSYNVGRPQIAISGESGIYLEKRNDTVYIGYSGATGGGGTGVVEYTGIDPIVVNNSLHTISAKSALLGVQSPLYFVEDSESATIIGFSGSTATGTIEGAMYESGLDFSDSYITTYKGSAFSAARSNYAASATSANTCKEISTSAGWDVVEYTAGNNIDITNHVISGKDWGSDISAASSYALSQATANIPDVTNLAYVQNTALGTASGSVTSISSYMIGNPQVPVSGESGVYLRKNDGVVYIGYSGGIDPASAEKIIEMYNVITAYSARWALI